MNPRPALALIPNRNWFLLGLFLVVAALGFAVLMI